MISLLSACLSFALSGCGDTSLRTGISPVLDVVSVQSAAANQATMLKLLRQDAGLARETLGILTAPRKLASTTSTINAPPTSITCSFLDRRGNELKSGLAAAAATTGAILGVTNASTISLAIVASAFGFASNATDIVAGTYFSRIPPIEGLSQHLPKGLPRRHRSNSGAINSRATAYYAIQRYLNLCLPPTIEAEITSRSPLPSQCPFRPGRGPWYLSNPGAACHSNRLSFSTK